MARGPRQYARAGLAAVAAAALLAAGGCLARRHVAGSSETVAVQTSPTVPAPSTARAPGPASASSPAPESASDPASDLDSSDAHLALSADSLFTTNLRSLLLEPGRAADRRMKFAAAVVKISADLGVPITAEQALRDMPCGGWSGPECSNLTIGLEIVKSCAPVIASFHRRRTAEIATVIVAAISLHSIWHDAYGYVRHMTKKGPGYTYAGCLFSRCDPEALEDGQVDGLVYQVGRLLGTLKSPACGPTCALGDL